MTVFATVERFYDDVPRQVARAEEVGPFTLFVPDRAGSSLYARPSLGAGTFEVADIEAVRARQRELRQVEAFEWVHESTPLLLPVARRAGLAVVHAPLMVLDASALPDVPGARILDPDAPGFVDDLRARRAVADVSFSHGGVAPGAAGPAQRDAALPAIDAATVAREVEWARSGRGASAVVNDDNHGVLASGAYQRVADVVEIVGVATLPAARGRGLGSAVTVALARQALRLGAGTVFLSAADVDVARIYQKLGFNRVGTACIAEPAGPR